MAERFKTYECRYYHDGTWWALQIAARDYPDAEARVRKLGNAQLSGEVVMTLPGSTPTWAVRLITWLRTAFSPSRR